MDGKKTPDLSGLDDSVKDYIFFLEQYRAVVDESNIISKTDPDGIITYVNRKFTEISGYTDYELIGKNHNIIRHSDMPARAFKSLWDAINAKKTWHGIIKNKKKDGGFYIVEATIIPVLDRSGEITEFIAIRKDITRLVDQRRQIKKQTTDPVTNLPNYNKLVEDMEQVKNKFLILLNVDMFQAIVDFYGEDMANNVLKELGERIFVCKENLSVKFNLYKMVADEYVLFADAKVNENQLDEIIQKILSSLTNDNVVFIKHMEVHFSFSIGAYMGGDAHALTKARVALKHGRTIKKGYYLYDEKLSRQHYKNFNEILVLKSAIKQNKIIPYYQPIVELKTGKITKYESLVRLEKGNKNIILPKEFLDTAKRSKLYPYITKTVISNVLEIAQKKPFDFSINLSVEDIVDRRINKMILDSVKNYPVKNKNLIFEITESENIHNFEEVNEFINQLKTLNCKIAIDDFGSGYSNFEYLAKLDIDYLKVDGSLIKNMTKDQSIYKIVKVIIDFAREMKYQTVAEYIENKEIMKLVEEIGFDYCQGFYIGQAEPEIS